jgi:hypothetical protein
MSRKAPRSKPTVPGERQRDGLWLILFGYPYEPSQTVPSTAPVTCTAWDLSQVPPGFVALDFGIFEGGIMSRGDSLKLPLALPAMTRAERRGSLVARYESGFKLGHRYLAYAYMGSGASLQQRRALRTMLSSINFTGGS